MDLFDVFARRYSVRAYQPGPLPEAALQAILEAAGAAPSAGNMQAYEIVVVREPERKKRLAQASLDQTFMVDAPVLIVFLANPERNAARYGRRGRELYALQDATIACAYAQLAATALGLGTCWIGAFDEEPVREAIEAPAAWRPVAILPIGVPADVQGHRARRAITSLVHAEGAPR